MALTVWLALAVIPWYAMENVVGCHDMPWHVVPYRDMPWALPRVAVACRGNVAACRGHCRGTATKHSNMFVFWLFAMIMIARWMSAVDATTGINIVSHAQRNEAMRGWVAGW